MSDAKREEEIHLTLDQLSNAIEQQLDTHKKAGDTMPTVVVTSAYDGRQLIGRIRRVQVILSADKDGLNASQVSLICDEVR